MIIRIVGEGQYRIPDALCDELNHNLAEARSNISLALANLGRNEEALEAENKQ